MHKYLNEGNSLTLNEVFDFLSQMCLTFMRMHAHKCFYGDLKPSNIMINKFNNKLYYILCDFSESEVFDSMTTSFKNLCKISNFLIIYL